MSTQAQPNPAPENQLSIDSIPAPTVPHPSPIVEKFTALEEHFYRVHAAGLQQDIEERKKYAHRIFCLISAWLIGVFLLLVAQGLAPYSHFALKESVVLAVIGSTTVNVLGIFYIVTNYLFPKH